jgi:hypothetical protein
MSAFYLPWVYLAGNLVVIGLFLVLHLPCPPHGELIAEDP